MDYKEIAAELLSVSSEMTRLKINKSVLGFSRGELFVLNFLKENVSKANSKDISKFLCVSSARVAVIVNQLEKKNYVERCADKEDSRRTVIKLTASGREFLSEKKEEVKNIAADMLKKLGKEDALEYLRIQKKIIALQKMHPEFFSASDSEKQSVQQKGENISER